MIENPTFWVGVSFVVFVALIFKRASKLLLGVLDKRAAQIRADLDNARRLLDEAQALLAEQKARAEKSTEEAEGIIAYGRAESARIREAATAEIAAVIKRREQQALERIAQVESSAVAEVRNRVVEVAMAASRQVLADANRNAAGAADPLVDDAIGSLAKHFH